MPYDRYEGQMIARAAMLRDADWPKAGISPIASLQDPKTGDNYFMGYNHPAAIPGCRGLWVFDTDDGYAWDHSFKGYNLTGTSIVTANYVDDVFGQGYHDFTGGTITRFYNNAGLLNQYVNRTFEVVVKTGSSVASKQWLIQCGANGNSHAASGGLYIDGPGLIRASMYTGAAYVHTSGAAIEADTYYHFALTMDLDNNLAAVFINGVKAEEISHTQSYSSTAINIGSHWASTSLQFSGTVFAARVTTRVLQPWEFMHHWYFNSMSQGVMGDGSILFDPAVSGFSRKTSMLVTGEWLNDGEANYGKITVNDIDGSDDTSFIPARNDPELLLPGSLPLIDDKCMAAWAFDGRLNPDGTIPDLTGRGYDAIRYGVDEADLEFNRYGRFYEANGETEYVQVPNLLQEFNRYQDNFTVDALLRVDATTTSKMIFGTNLNETRIYCSIYNSEWDFGLGDQGWGVSSTIELLNTPDTSWHLFSIVKDGSNGYLYVDGELVASKSSIVWNGWTDTTFSLFSYSSLSSSYATDKTIAFTRVSKVVRTRDEMKQMFYAQDRLDGYIQDIFLPGGSSLSRRIDG